MSDIRKEIREAVEDKPEGKVFKLSVEQAPEFKDLKKFVKTNVNWLNKRIRELIDINAEERKETKASVERLLPLPGLVKKEIDKIPKPPKAPKEIKVSNFPDTVKLERPKWWKDADSKEMTVPLAKVINEAVRWASKQVNRVHITNQTPEEAVAVKLTTRDGRKFYNAIQGAVSSVASVFPFINTSGNKQEALVDTTGHLQIDRINALVTTSFDYIGVAYPNATTETYTFKTGGAGGTTVATVTVIYTDATKADLSTVTKT